MQYTTNFQFKKPEANEGFVEIESGFTQSDDDKITGTVYPIASTKVNNATFTSETDALKVSLNVLTANDLLHNDTTNDSTKVVSTDIMKKQYDEIATKKAAVEKALTYDDIIALKHKKIFIAEGSDNSVRAVSKANGKFFFHLNNSITKADTFDGERTVIPLLGLNIVYLNGYYCSIINSDLMYSKDLVSFKIYTLPEICGYVATANNKLFVFPSTAATGYFYEVSLNDDEANIILTTITVPASPANTGFVYGNGKYVYHDDTIYILDSNFAVTSVSATIVSSIFFRSVDNLFYAIKQIDDTYNLVSSPDGLTWTVIDTVNCKNLFLLEDEIIIYDSDYGNLYHYNLRIKELYYVTKLQPTSSAINYYAGDFFIPKANALNGYITKIGREDLKTLRDIIAENGGQIQ